MTDAKYWIESFHSGGDRVEITEAEYCGAVDAQQRLHLLATVPELFSYVAENFIEIEAAANEIAYRQTLWGGHHELDDHADIHVVNRRVMNFLTTARAFLDQAPSLLKKAIGDEICDRFKNATNDAFDRSAHYKICEGLRNAVQHACLPLKGITMHYAKTEKKGGRATCYCKFDLDTERFLASSVSRKYKDAVSAKGKSLDIRVSIREYMDQLSQVFCTVATDMTAAMVDSVSNIETLTQQFGDANSGKPLKDWAAFYVRRTLEEGQPRTRLSVFRVERFNRLMGHYGSGGARFRAEIATQPRAKQRNQ